jgi:hypothetical protein
LTARAAIGRNAHAFPRLTRRKDTDRLGVAARALPHWLVVGVSAAIFAVAAFSIVWTVTVDPTADLAEAGAAIVTGTIKAN